MVATSGDLRPHVSFYYGTSTYVSSDHYNLDGNTITKTYTAEGHWYIPHRRSCLSAGQCRRLQPAYSMQRWSVCRKHPRI